MITEKTIDRGYQLCALMAVCEHAARQLDNVGEGNYRDKLTGDLANVLELAGDLAMDLLVALERAKHRDDRRAA